MSHIVKQCEKCKIPNSPERITCMRCGADLPAMRTSSIEPPWQPPPAEEQPIQPNIPAPAVNTIVEARIVDIDMPFWSMVNFMVKWALAFIPALIVLAVFIFFALAVLAALGYSITTP